MMKTTFFLAICLIVIVSSDPRFLQTNATNASTITNTTSNNATANATPSNATTNGTLIPFNTTTQNGTVPANATVSNAGVNVNKSASTFMTFSGILAMIIGVFIL